MARFLNQKTQPTTPLRVMVGNGQELCCSQVCKAIPVVLEGHSFIVDLFVMSLAGADLVFGVQ